MALSALRGDALDHLEQIVGGERHRLAALELGLRELQRADAVRLRDRRRRIAGKLAGDVAPPGRQLDREVQHPLAHPSL